MNIKHVHRIFLPVIMASLIVPFGIQAGGDEAGRDHKGSAWSSPVSTVMAHPKKALLIGSAALFGVTYAGLTTNSMSVDPVSVLSLIGASSALYGCNKAYMHLHQHYDHYNRQLDEYINEKPFQATALTLGGMPIVAWSTYYLTPWVKEAVYNPKITTAVIGAGTVSYYGYKCYEWLSGKSAQKEKQRKIAERKKELEAVRKQRKCQQEQTKTAVHNFFGGLAKTTVDDRVRELEEEIEALENGSS